MMQILPLALQSLLATFFAPQIAHPAPLEPLRFQLRHEHAVRNDSRIVFADIPSSFAPELLEVPVKSIKSHRPRSHAAFLDARQRSLRNGESVSIQWDTEETVGPDVGKRNTLLQLAKMTYNSYSSPEEKDWYEMDGEWNSSIPFGWKPEDDGFRGYVFATEDNSTVVISIKGTSAGWLVGGGGPTVGKDKINDNLLFSCCCAHVNPTWSTVCDCHAGGYRCDQTCLEKSLVDDSLFYPTGLNLYTNVSMMYPNSDIWVVGHSLGGGLASLVGVTFGAPVVAFEAPGEKMASQRLHLTLPPSLQHITHVYHTADPIPLGACTGIASLCSKGGFALETSCHLGKSIRYDTVSKLGWRVGIHNHPIKVIIDSLLNEDWDKENGVEVPPAEEENDCVDCFSWEYGEYQNATKRRTWLPHLPHRS